MITNYFFITRCPTAWTEKRYLFVEDIASTMTKKLSNKSTNGIYVTRPNNLPLVAPLVP